MKQSSVQVQEYAKFIDLPVQRKLLSLLEGRHGGSGAGSSHEFLDMAEYKVGDDVSDIDWKASARLSQPVVKRFEATAVLNVVLAVDTGSNMAALASGRISGSDTYPYTPPVDPRTGLWVEDAAPDFEEPEPKEDVSATLVTALAWLTAYRGDLLGLVAGDSEGLATMPARSGLSHAQTMQRVATRATPAGAAGDFNAVLRRVDAVRRHRALVIAISDLEGAESVDAYYLKRLCYRHDVFFFIVEDLDPTRFSHPEDLPLVDVQSGPLPDFASGNGAGEAIAAQWRMAQRLQRQRVEEKLRRHGIRWAYVGSSQGVTSALLTAFGGEPRGAASS